MLTTVSPFLNFWIADRMTLGFLGTFTAQPKNSAFGGASRFLI